jgi:hypothetical protein
LSFCQALRDPGLPFGQYCADGASDQKEVRNRVERFNRKLEQLLGNGFAPTARRFSDTFDPDVSAHTIMAIYLGLMVLAKDAPDAAPRPRHVKSGLETA